MKRNHQSQLKLMNLVETFHNVLVEIRSSTVSQTGSSHGQTERRKERKDWQTDIHIWVGRNAEGRTDKQTCRQTDGQRERDRFLICLHNGVSVLCKASANNAVHLHRTGTRIHVTKLYFDGCLETLQQRLLVSCMNFVTYLQVLRGRSFVFVKCF